MKPIDIVLLLLIIITIALVIYFGIWKNRKSPCHGCPYAGKENCNCNTKTNYDTNNSNDTIDKTQTNNKIKNNNHLANEDKNSSNKI